MYPSFKKTDHDQASRRQLVFAAISLPVAGMASTDNGDRALASRLTHLERSAGGRLGISAISPNATVIATHRPNERFPFCSTFKLMLVATVLARSASDNTLLNRHITYKASDLLAVSPITKAKLATGASVAELCAATLQYSDNAAANLLLKLIGGPAAVTRYARSIGDKSFRLDRNEPSLNSAIPGDLRDTTTPMAMTLSLHGLLLGDKLGASQREQLKTWMLGNTTGAGRILAGVPKGWLVADKTGTGVHGTTNDVGVVWPVGREPFVIAIYFTQPAKDAAANEEVLAAATRIVVSALA